MTLFAAGCNNSFLSSQKRRNYKETKWMGEGCSSFTQMIFKGLIYNKNLLRLRQDRCRQR